MAKGIAVFTFLTPLFVALTFSSCTKTSPAADVQVAAPEVESFPISPGQFKNCNFQTVAPSYGLNSPITPNPIDCQEGVATTVQLLSTTPLPTGLSFSMNTLSLVGTPIQKVSNAPYDFYIENNAGYLILRLTITVN